MTLKIKKSYVPGNDRRLMIDECGMEKMAVTKLLSSLSPIISKIKMLSANSTNHSFYAEFLRYTFRKHKN